MNKYLLIILIIVVVEMFGLILSINQRTEVDEQTKTLCRWYASQNHDGEIGEERMEKMGWRWVNFDWYDSCIKNNK